MLPSLEIKFNAYALISIDGISLYSNPNILPSFSPLTRKNICNRGMPDDARADQIIRLANAGMFPQNWIAFLIDLTRANAILFILLNRPSRLSPVGYEQDRKRRLPIGIFFTPVVCKAEGRQKEENTPKKKAKETRTTPPLPPHGASCPMLI